ncbi:hypothetical protein PROFUN_08572 [Planoprotostelium fungivorum]|uniref:Uncharacterized protein n=1 Tax=Planoprotostelium fungivorum TaxID=1890364 RepID=A0A2P6N1Q5_9EUKA|nr:hypothetical protein PROFUN_08572 [Planoprotostelium fungivorum]
MIEKLLSPDILPLCYFSHYFLVALKARVYDMAAQIASHLKLTVQSSIEIFSPVDEWRSIRLENGWFYEMRESVSLLELADRGLMYLLEPIIREGNTGITEGTVHLLQAGGDEYVYLSAQCQTEIHF